MNKKNTQKISITLEKCRICDSLEIPQMLDLGVQPLANSLQPSLEENELKIPLVICRCNSCGTVQLTETVSPNKLFEDYIWVTGTSEVAKSYSEIFCDRVTKLLDPGAHFVLEIASNDGTFLKPFLARGDRVLGVDPAKNIADIAQKNGVPTEVNFFGLSVAKEVVKNYGRADLVFARNVIPHVANANDVINGMAYSLLDNGVGAIEFHSADVILRELHYDSIYHEHLYYHSIHSLSLILSKYGLIPFDIDTSPISGGSYVLYFSKLKRAQSQKLINALKAEEELGVNQRAAWENFGARAFDHRQRLNKIIQDSKSDGKKIIGYGASARSSTLLNFCGINSSHLDAIIDRAELKQGLYAPGTRVPIVSPDSLLEIMPDVILLLAWNFEEEILQQIRQEHGWRGQVIIPLPECPRMVELK